MKCPKAIGKCHPQIFWSCGLQWSRATSPRALVQGPQARGRDGVGRFALQPIPQDCELFAINTIDGSNELWYFTPQPSPTEATSSATIRPQGSQGSKPFARSTAVSAFKSSNRALAAQQIWEKLSRPLPNLNPLFLLQHNPLFCLRNVHFRKQLLRLSELPILHTRSSAFAQSRHSQLKCCH